MTKKEDEILARQHVTWYMKRLREQFECWAGITEQLMVDNFIHGMKHAREQSYNEAREFLYDDIAKGKYNKNDITKVVKENDK